MQVIPVIDLQAGNVVHAVRGERQRYRPIASRLCAGSAPLDIVRALLDVHDFATLYVADLDAIAGRGGHDAQISTLHAAFPQLELWVDCGLDTPQAARAWQARDTGTAVLGSETLRTAAQLRALRAALHPQDAVLSLDFRSDALLGEPELLECVEDWPARVIVMTLARVGSAAGPDWARLRDVLARAGPRRVFAAGGVRGGDDLLELVHSGVSGVLVATALHDRSVGRAEIAAVAG